MRSSVQESPDQTEKLVARRDDVQTCRATTQRDEFSLQLELVEVVQAQVCAAEAYAGEHGIVLAKAAVRGDVDQRAVRSSLAERGLVCLGAHEQLGVGQNF